MMLNVNSVFSSTKKPSVIVPQIIGYYSMDSGRNYKPDLSQIKYFVPPDDDKVHFNLNNCFDQFIDRSPTLDADEKIEHLLRFIETHLKDLTKDGSGKILPYDFVCLRGVLLRVMRAVYEKEDWTICAINFKGTIYMWTSEKEKNDYPEAKKFTHWGCQFKKYMFSKAPNMEPEGEMPTNSNEEFCIAFSSTINSMSVLYSVKVDGVESDTPIDEERGLNGAKLVEVKTNKIIKYGGSRYFKMKTLKWFCQEHLIGVEDLYVGFRDDQGIVHKVQKFRVEELARNASGIWDKHYCLIFLDSFLQFVKDTVSEGSNPHEAWLFDFHGENKDVSVRKSEHSKDLFLPDWYIELINGTA